MRTKSVSRIITREPSWLGPAIPPGEILLEEFLAPLEGVDKEMVTERPLTRSP